MKWKIWKKKTNETIQYQPCCECGKKIMRQTTLDEFFDMTPVSQQRLTPLPVGPLTERFGLQGEVRRYRGRY